MFEANKNGLWDYEVLVVTLSHNFVTITEGRNAGECFLKALQESHLAPDTEVIEFKWKLLQGNGTEFTTSVEDFSKQLIAGYYK